VLIFSTSLFTFRYIRGAKSLSGSFFVLTPIEKLESFNFFVQCH
jgi:hypothetical protein